MTKNLREAILHGTLVEDQRGVAERLLSPLLAGKTVWLRVEDKRLPKKTRRYKTVLVLAPISALGVEGDVILASMPPYGAEFLDTSAPIKAMTLARLGLGFTLALALAEALGKLYGDRHGT